MDFSTSSPPDVVSPMRSPESALWDSQYSHLRQRGMTDMTACPYQPAKRRYTMTAIQGLVKQKTVPPIKRVSNPKVVKCKLEHKRERHDHTKNLSLQSNNRLLPSCWQMSRSHWTTLRTSSSIKCKAASDHLLNMYLSRLWWTCYVSTQLERR